MKELPKILYTMRMTLFILQFVALFMIISSLLQMKIVFYLFLVFYLFYVIKVITELLSKKKVYQNDLIYNAMQIGLFAYIFVLFYRIYFSFVYVSENTMPYFNINFGIICLLLIFINIYSFIELRNKK